MKTGAGLALAVLLGSVTPASADLVISLTVSGDEARGTIILPLGIRADLTIAFEDVTGLTPTALRASVRLVSPLDLGLLGRLPGLVSVPGAFPVALKIEPTASSTLTFAGVVEVSLHTPNLDLDPILPLALYSASGGGPFRDITVEEGAGSYRVCGSGGGFSEFLIVLDLQPIDPVIVGKLDALQALLVQHAASMPLAVVMALQASLDETRDLYESGDTADAAAQAAEFSDDVLAHSGTDIPDVWKANDPSYVNVAGQLRSSADTLKFSLNRKVAQGP